MKISVIIPTYNEKSVLSDCIQSLGGQTITNFEIIVVDDGSTDGTTVILENLKKTLPDFSYYIQNHKGAGAARNYGASKSSGQILVFVDADMTFDKDFIKSLVYPIINKTSKGTFSKDEIVSNWSNVWSRCWNIQEGWEAKKRHPADYPDTQPVFRAILKSEFNKVGGFTPGGYDDDWSLSKKLGYPATASLGAIFYHKNPDTLSEVFMQAKWVAKRPYKLGVLGSLIALLRASFPVSLLVGIWKAVINSELQFILFKIIYDFGIFFGILESVFLNKLSK